MHMAHRAVPHTRMRAPAESWLLILIFDGHSANGRRRHRQGRRAPGGLMTSAVWPLIQENAAWIHQALLLGLLFFNKLSRSLSRACSLRVCLPGTGKELDLALSI